LILNQSLSICLKPNLAFKLSFGLSGNVVTEWLGNIVVDSQLKYHCSIPGSLYGMADLHGHPTFERFPAIGMFGVDMIPADKFPRLTSWMSSMQQLDCVRKVWISPKLYYYYFTTSVAGNPDYDVEMDEETVAMQISVGAYA